ncbi:phosphatidylinositol 4,5-bisphosphate 3-kinase catalytic subunit beta isoform isoform X2 [Hydra vulgaris]|uniref:phosphatidylinositol-4-phosphate 3-kinase n=1 Tax=Hydra vulgaris TaxID=6087 RepID=A0ABM4B6S7_HYDVU
MVTGALARYNIWNGLTINSKIDVLCMLPSGICITLQKVQIDIPLSEIKNKLWQDAAHFSNKTALLLKENYVFVAVSAKGGTEELMDEELSLFDIKPVRPYLKIVQKQGDESVKLISSKINLLIGNNTISSKNEEVDEFRSKCIQFCDFISYQRSQSSWDRKAIYTYPPEFEEDYNLSSSLKEKLRIENNCIHLSVSIVKNSFITFKVAENIYPKELIEKVLCKKIQTSKLIQKENVNDYVLKVYGRLNFFLGHVITDSFGNEFLEEKPILQYKYVRDCLQWDKPIRLVLIAKADLDIEKECAAPILDNPPPTPEKRRKNEICLWDISPRTLFKVNIFAAKGIHNAQMWKEIHCGIFHGGEEVCKVQSTNRLQQSTTPHWNEFLEFDLPVADIPRMARLCFSIVGYQQNDRRKRKPVCIGWVNMPIFNYKAYLKTGTCALYCWQYSIGRKNENQNFLNPLGTVASSGDENGACLIIKLTEFAHPVVYPSEEKIIQYAADKIKAEQVNGDQPHPYLRRGGKLHRQQIEEVIQRDTLLPMFEKEKELMWLLRVECSLEYPQCLPKLLQCVKWNNRDSVAQIHLLLTTWKIDPLEVDVALDLLDYKFPDNNVRTIAVKVLDNLTDGELEMYLLQLIQALKYESYLDSPLAKYLLKRALNNRRIGHYLFWHLKAEAGNLECSLQFGLLLELYCRGSVQHIDILTKQVEAINKMKTMTEYLHQCKDQSKEDKIEMMRNIFNGPSYKKAFSEIVSPLDPSIKLKCLRVEKCKYMDSKKKPLWLVFENVDEGADDVVIIFKNGDDLRQDMLTVLSLRIMDNVWKKAGLDYGIIPYRCLSTGPMLGLIEVVPESETLGKIQFARGTFGTWKDDTFFLWLKDQCQGSDEKLEKFIQSFTRSVVGYSIATYVLGVGDRHNDNIMMKKDTGQLFHIDFGHFLGNFKTKFGFKRERVKFVLTSDIVYVISKHMNIDDFKDMCIVAFKTLRSRGNLFITIFAMLLSTGIPELEHPNDIEYIRESMALTKDEADAVRHFEMSYREAYNNRASTTLNWSLHNVVHNW